MRRVAIALCLVFACKHDADELGGRQEDVSEWLGLAAQPACAQCLEVRCDAVERCLDDEECKQTVPQCMPPDPGCAQATVATRDMTTCIMFDCGMDCSFPSLAQGCIGKYDWVAPIPAGPMAFELRLRQFITPYTGTASVTPCFGPSVVCEHDALVTLKQDDTVLARYTATLARARPYFRVRGEGLREMIFYEDASISSGYQVNVPALVESDYQLLLGFLGTTELENKGTLDVVMWDCKGKRFPGVQLQLTRAGQPLAGADLGMPYYFDERLPKPAQVQPQTSEALGQGGFVNLEPGVYDLTATLQGALIARIESVAVEPRVVTHVNLMPLSLDEVPQR